MTESNNGGNNRPNFQETCFTESPPPTSEKWQRLELNNESDYTTGSEQNPFETFKLCLLTFDTKRSAKRAGLLSFLLFTLITLGLFINAPPSFIVYLAIIAFFIVGSYCYGSLRLSFIGDDTKQSKVGPYLIFESLQLCYLLAVSVFAGITKLLSDLTYYQSNIPYHRSPNSNAEFDNFYNRNEIVDVSDGYELLYNNDTQRQTTTANLMHLLTLTIMLVLAKAYFLFVIFKYYRFVCFRSRCSEARRQTVIYNAGSGLPIALNTIGPPPYYSSQVRPSRPLNHPPVDAPLQLDLSALPTYDEIARSNNTQTIQQTGTNVDIREIDFSVSQDHRNNEALDTSETTDQPENLSNCNEIKTNSLTNKETT